MKEMFVWILNFFGGLVKRNFGLKICSVVLAIISWFVVMNIINPTEEKVYTVELTLLNEDKLTENNIVALNKEDLLKSKVDIRVKATRSDLDTLDKKENRQKIAAKVDLNQFSSLYSQNIEEPVYAVVVPELNQDKSGYQIVSFSPMYFDINLDKYISITKEVLVNTSGSTAEGYVSSNLKCDPEKVEISGSATAIKNVDHVYVDFDYAGATENIEKSAVPIAYDSDGNKVSGVSINAAEVKVSARISNKGITKILPPDSVGEPAAGYIVSAVTCSPDIIEIIGDENAVAALKEIKINDFDIAGSTATRTFNYDISGYLKSFGVEAKNTSDTNITVKIEIEKKAEKNVRFDSSKIVLSGKNTKLYEYTVVQENDMRISGKKADIDKFDLNSVTVVCDVADLKDGVHSIAAQPNISPHAGISIENIPTFAITVTTKEGVEAESKNEIIAENTMVEETTEGITEKLSG